MEQTQKRIDAMSRVCAGMTLEEMQNAAFTYQSLLEIVQRRDVRNACVPESFEKTGRELWTVGDWCEHFGGRHKDDNPLNYYEFGSMWAIAKMMQSHAITHRRIGWNQCREAMISKIGDQK